ncbi:unnamed protein product [Allacma fusca]|uniref:Uncharacterized protein n=1 Tax=Allacma fusca TaxID=39272 RepID=A0A8J2K7A3_9HEXA|nr:unnamed protein product [Allacma fusca]
MNLLPSSQPEPPKLYKNIIRKQDEWTSSGCKKGTKHRVDQIQKAESVVHRAGSWGDLLLRQKQITDSQTSINKSGDQGVPSRHVNNTDSRDDVRIVAQVKPGHSRRKSRRDKIYEPNSAYYKEHGHVHECSDKGKNLGVHVQVPVSHNSQTRCCDACTCFITQHVKDQESQTSLLAPPVQITSKVRKSPPTKEQDLYIRRSAVQELTKAKVSHSNPEKPGPRRQSSSRRSEIITIRRFEDAQVQTKDSQVSTTTRETDDIEHMNLLKDLKKLSELEQENLLLKHDTSKLLEQVEKSKTERQEYITTIKELYELAEVLRHENVILIGTHEEHRTLQERLSEALGENQVLKRHLDELSTRISQSSIEKSKDNEIRDFWKVRDVLKEVKTVISQEINGLQQANGRNSPSQIDESDILELFGRTKDPKDFNDTNLQCDDEIQKILNASKEIADSQRNYVPSPDSDPSSL